MEFLKNFSLKTKLLFLCVFISGVAGTIGTISYRGLHDVEDSYDKITDVIMPKLESANEMFVSYRRIRIMLRTLGLPGITPAQSADAIKGTLESINTFEEAHKKYISLGFSDGQKDLHDIVDANWIAFKAVGERVLNLQKVGTVESQQAMVQIFFTDCPEAAAKFTASMTKLLNFHKEHAALQKTAANKTGEHVNFMIGLVGILGILVGMSVGFLFATSVSKSILKVSNTLAKNAESVSSASTQIAASSGSLSEAATEQAASLEETAASLVEITAMIEKAAESAKMAATSSTQSQQKAQEGRDAVEQVMHSMDEISESNLAIMNQVNDSNVKMFEIVKVIEEIGNKTKVINDIVFQTKLLSFNASVEAARAGEHGKGFAVVAEEVGKLAQMSGNAAKEISDMLESSISKVDTLVSESKSKVENLASQGKRKVEAGVEVARRCGEVLNEIVQNVSQVSELAREISQATTEQAQGVAEINKAMGQLDAVTQNNTTSSAEAAHAAASLSSQAESLKSAVDELSHTIEGASANERYAA